MNVHNTAVVDPGAKLASDVEIGPYANVGPGVVLAPKVKVHAHATLEFAELGEGCEVYPYAALGLPAQHLGYKGEPAKVVVGKNTIFREFVTVHRGTAFDKSVTLIGDQCFFMAQSHVAHDCRVGHNVVMANGAMLGGHVEVGNRSFISGLVAVHQFVRIGQGSMVSGGAMVNQDVPPFSTVQGDRAVWRGLNLVGLKRSGASRDSIRNLKNAYRILYFSNLRLEDALKDPIFSTSDPQVQELKAFFSHPKRGFTRPVGPETAEDNSL